MRILFLLALAAQFVLAQASLIVENAAHEDPLDSLLLSGGSVAYFGPGPQIAPGSLVRLVFHPASGDSSITDLSKSKVSIRVVDSGQVFAVQVIQAPRQLAPIIAYIQPETPVGNADVILEIDDHTTVTRRIQLVPTSLGIFKKRGAADAQNIRANGTSSQNGLTTPAHPGDYVTIWATGLGAATEEDVSVTLGGRPAIVTYAGPAPGLLGVDQINFQIPDDPQIPDACYLALSVPVANHVADGTSLTKTNTADACTHPLGLSKQQMARLDAGGTAPLGSIAVSSTIQQKTILQNSTSVTLGYTRSDTASASFQELDAAAIAERTGVTGSGGTPTAAFRSGDFSAAFGSAPETLDAGPELTLAGGGNVVDMPGSGRPGFVTYSATLPEPAPVSDPGMLAGTPFTGGIWSIEGSGGAGIAAFTRTVHLSPAIHVKRVPGFPKLIDTRMDQVFEWDPAGYAEDDLVSVRLSIVTGVRSPFISVGLGVGVRVPARSGRAVFPARILAPLTPATPNLMVTGSLSLSVSNPSGQSFTVPLKDGEAAPVRFGYSSSEQVSVLIR